MTRDDDISARLARAEEGRRAAEIALQESQRGACVGSWTWQVEPDIVTWSDEMFRIAGRDPRAGAPSYAEQSSMYNPPEVLARAVAHTLASGEPFEVEVALLRPDGEPRWIIARGAAMTDAGGRIERVYGSARDITDARAQRLALQTAHDELERSERRYRDLVENLVDVVFSVDLAGYIEFVSRAVERFGYTPAELTGQHFSRLFDPADLPALDAAFRQTLEGSAEPTESRLIDKSGGVRYVQISARAVHEAGQISGMTGFAVDVTRQRQAEEQLQASQRLEAVGRLAGGVAHDFNNLLVVILGFADLALDRLGPDDPARASIDQICRAGERAAALIRQLLAFSRRQVLKPEVIDLNDVVGGIESMLLRLIGEDVRFRTKLRPGLEPVLADPGQIEQVLMNLVVNARDAMPGGGTLTIETTRGTEAKGTAGWVVLRVRDTGRGMDAATKAQIFEPFFTTKPQGEGTGLGLSPVYGIVKQSGGTISVDTAPGRGTTFTLAFPPDTSGTPPVRRSPVRELGAGGRGTETILIVEDEDGVRDLAYRFLSTAGYEVIAAANAADAERAFGEDGRRIDLLLTDVVMPRMNGDELAARLCARRPDLRVLFMSGYSGAKLSAQFEAHAPARLVSKPFTRMELSRRVREALDAPPPFETDRPVDHSPKPATE
ncbi:MAG: PAS domain S-box protein [Vicinamibacterales bacterium]